MLIVVYTANESKHVDSRRKLTKDSTDLFIRSSILKTFSEIQLRFYPHLTEKFVIFIEKHEESQNFVKWETKCDMLT